MSSDAVSADTISFAIQKIDAAINTLEREGYRNTSAEARQGLSDLIDALDARDV